MKFKTREIYDRACGESGSSTGPGVVAWTNAQNAYFQYLDSLNFANHPGAHLLSRLNLHDAWVHIPQDRPLNVFYLDWNYGFEPNYHGYYGILLSGPDSQLIRGHTPNNTVLTHEIDVSFGRIIMRILGDHDEFEFFADDFHLKSIPYGFELKIDGSLNVNVPEKMVADLVSELRLKGMDDKQISIHLNESGNFARFSRKWNQYRLRHAIPI